MSNLANLGIFFAGFFGGLGIFFLGVDALWRTSLKNKEGETPR